MWVWEQWQVERCLGLSSDLPSPGGLSQGLAASPDALCPGRTGRAVFLRFPLYR